MKKVLIGIAVGGIPLFLFIIIFIGMCAPVESLDSQEYFQSSVGFMTYTVETNSQDEKYLSFAAGAIEFEKLQDNDENNVPMEQYSSIAFSPKAAFSGQDVYAVVLYVRASADCTLSLSLVVSPTVSFAKEVTLQANSSGYVEWKIDDWLNLYEGGIITVALDNPYDVDGVSWSFDNVLFCARS